MKHENPCRNRHTYGVGEKVKFLQCPMLPELRFGLEKWDGDDDFYDAFHDENGPSEHTYICPIASDFQPRILVSCYGAEYRPDMVVIEPQEVIAMEVGWLDGKASFGEVGQAILVTTNYIAPMTVSFRGIMVAEIPCDEVIPATGYFSTDSFTGFRSHTVLAGAGYAFRVKSGNRWMEDRAGGGVYSGATEGTMEWNIPIGWLRLKFDDDFSFVSREAQTLYKNDKNSAPLLIGRRVGKYKQSFSIDNKGISTVEKFGHKLSRGKHRLIMLDGKTERIGF